MNQNKEVEYIRLYLYAGLDSDLLSLYATIGKKDFIQVMKDSLRVLLHPGHVSKIPIPDELVPYIYEDKKDYTVFIQTSIKGEVNADIRELLSHVTHREKTSFIKLAMRFYIGPVKTFKSKLDVDNLIKTTPIFTPSGVIVLNTPDYTDDRPNRQNKVNQINKIIQEKTQDAEVSKPVEVATTPASVKETLPEAPVPVINQIPSATSIPSSIPQSVFIEEKSDENIKAEDFGFEENDPTESDDTDILAMLEGLM